MARSNNLLRETAAPSLHKLRLLCDKFVQDAADKGIAVDIYITNRYEKISCSQKDEKKTVFPSATVDSAKCLCRTKWVLVAAVVLISAVCLHSQTQAVARLLFDEFLTSKCIVRNNYFVMEATRPPTDCHKVCQGVSGPTELSANVTREEFTRWAYLSRPLVVRQGAAHWPALEKFSLAFFRSVYDSIDGSYEAVSEECQFLPFRSEFVDLREALGMHPARAARMPGTDPWYFGWSNCSPEVSTILRELAPRPSFLPEQSESSALDWIFMGGEGPGAAWHLDYVQRPSWQAQVSGTKTWHFRPVPECQDTCQSFSATIYKGDIVFVDTNQWYHTTFIHRGPLSITIGSEYD
ncbi:uncharacterized protein LOC135206941 [Macrobrachium nipponense]|uniref:uncharacterized protein LOC135206941 n=1 Tax=Macrobrachium nipponense TaxID=159736 RepID=UPI0030C7FF9E